MFKNKMYWMMIFLISSMSFVSCAPQYKAYHMGDMGVPIAVWDLDDVSPSGSARPDLGKLFSDRIIEILKGKKDYSPVEREHLLAILDELNLGTTSLVDESTRLELGRLVGARLMVFGGYQIIGDKMRIDLRLVDVESGKVVKAVPKTTIAHGLSEWLNTISEAVEDLL